MTHVESTQSDGHGPLLDATPTAAPPVMKPAPVASREGAHWFNARLEALGDRLNPILVKETRQALKSQQFSITFVLLLACGWAWSLLGIALSGPDIYYSSEGVSIFFGYFLILFLPLSIVVPYGAFRSILSEHDENTFELLSITTLKPRQMIAGKLGSSTLQAVVYLSALAPCMVFSYLLGGISLASILTVLIVTFLTSIGLSLLALLMGTVTRQRHWQTAVSVVMLIPLAIVFFAGAAMVVDILQFNAIEDVMGQDGFWPLVGMMATAYCSYFALLFAAATAQITFEAENRSTPLRLIMVGQHVLLTAWMAWIFAGISNRDPEVVLGYLMLLGIHWFVMGGFMTGESPDLSARVKRQLPRTFLGRVFLTWFNPGPLTGYVLAISGTVAGGILALTLLALPGVVVNWRGLTTDELILFNLFGICYIVIFLGVGRLIIGLLRKVIPFQTVGAVLVHGLLLAVMSSTPVILQMFFRTLNRQGFSLLQMTNPFWTLAESVDGSLSAMEVATLCIVLPITALLVFGFNLLGLTESVRHVRVATPARVIEEDVQTGRIVLPEVKPSSTSPWD
jgi:hypothetical protein